MTEEQISEIIGAALFERQRERCLEGPNPSFLPEWEKLDESAKAFWRKDGAAAIAALKSAGLAIVPVEPTREMFEQLASKQVRLGPEFEKAIFDDVEGLYEP